MPASGVATPLPQPSMQSTKERTMLFYPHRKEFFIQLETYRTDPTRADELIEAIHAKWALLREENYTDDPARFNPSPAVSRVLST